MKRIRLLIAGILSISFLAVSAPALASPYHFAATAKDESCQALKDISPGSGDCANPEGKNLNGLVRLSINIISIVAGVIAVIMLIVAGLKYITSQGDSAQVASAKNALIYAVVGLVVVASAQILVSFVLKKSLNA